MSQLSPGPSTLPTPSEPVSVILPHLLLGSDAIPQAQDGIAQLKSLGVTHVLNMAVEVENKVIEASGEFEVKWCLAEDHAEHDIEGTIKEALDWIGKRQPCPICNVIFVHCKAGRSRSATTAIAYLVVHERMRLRDAYEKVKQARPGVSPNLGFMLALLRIEKEVHGENTAAAAPTTDHSKAHNAEPRSHSHGELMA
ncbi:protein-tyrosine phosphatase-like protein [Fimicolochytrium jonesii]|uniref:protein-tyrosine phosphatase-like protein n=1 Tax=Fimicolochytrium jonesii TaxID=1396493 RepID=UPI0022FE709B|nr:protein-tyrosine phosphatase-like protein [Fimicolochytrium jonesii]KAI8826989.1 protein-tyrosine phosphatase-like protein [Fimicolochytrium jonesii]